jgi:hypothetical protein
VPHTEEERWWVTVQSLFMIVQSGGKDDSGWSMDVKGKLWRNEPDIRV